MPNEEITINGFRFLVPCPYTEGHPCTGAEALILNRKLHSNLRANFAKIMDSMVVEGKSPESFTRELAKRFSEYCAEYTLNGQDPVDAEAKAIALAMIKSGLKKAGKKLGEITSSEIDRRINEVLRSSQRGDIYTQARSRIKLLNEAAKRELARLSS